MTRPKKFFSDTSHRLGIFLAVHALFVIVVKVCHGTPWQLLWFCHVSLALAAIGLLTRSKLILATALTNVFVLHSLWIIDFTIGCATGSFPIAFSEYARDLDGWDWIASLHHLYLLPLLLWLFWRERDYPREAWLISATLFVLLLLPCRGLLSPAQNVNYAYFIPETLELYGASTLNQLPGDLYLFGLHVVVNVLAFFPAASALNAFARIRRRRDCNSSETMNCASA